MNINFTFCCCSMIICTVVGSILSHTPYDPDVRHFSTFKGGDKMGYINFEFPFIGMFLDVSPIVSTVTNNFTSCAAKCIEQRTPPCLSLNIEYLSTNEYQCSILGTDKYREFESFKAKTNTIHYAIKSECNNNACPGRHCIPHYDNRTFECFCREGYIEVDGKCFEIVKLPKNDGIAEESSTFDGNPSNAVDGNYKQNHLSGRICSHTGLSDIHPWWQFTFNYDVIIHSVHVYGRDTSIQRLDNAIVTVYDDASNSMECGDTGIMSLDPSTVICSTPLLGRGVRVAKDDTKISICEIDFYGVIVP